MRITITSTNRVIEGQIQGRETLVPARVWEGYTDNGIPVMAIIALIAVRNTEQQDEFERDLKERHAPPSPDAVKAFPMKMVM